MSFTEGPLGATSVTPYTSLQVAKDSLGFYNHKSITTPTNFLPQSIYPNYLALTPVP